MGLLPSLLNLHRHLIVIDPELFGYHLQLVQRQPQILQDSILHLIHQPMNPQLLPLYPRLLHTGYLGYVVHLGLDVELHEEVLVLLLCVFEQVLEADTNVTHMS